MSDILIESSKPNCVVLLHGLARTKNSMNKLEKRLRKENYSVVNLGYDSRRYTIEELASKAINEALDKCPPNGEINFVTHSLGGILVRQYLQQHTLPNLNRVVMLGPPNKGSEVVDRLRKIPGFNIINGQAGKQLGTDQKSIPNKLGAAEFDLGIIAGTQSVNLILSMFIPGTDDGKVSIESTKLEGMNDHIQIPTTHPFMMENKHVVDQVVYYLQHGQFNHQLQFNTE